MAARPFDTWVKRKDHFERGCKLLTQLDDERADDAEKWFAVTVALAAIDRAIEPDDENDYNNGIAWQKPERQQQSRRRPIQRHNGPALDGARSSPKSMYEVWRKWTIDMHTFTDVRLTSEEEDTLSQALKENAYEDKGHVVLPTLRYVKPSKPHNRSVLPKPLSADQLAQNKIFLGRCRSEWRNACREMRVRLGKYLSSVGGGVGPSERARATICGLRILGVVQLAKWVEEDVDTAARKKKEDDLEREDQAKMTHAAFVKKKNTTVVRMRETDAEKQAPPPPRFDLSMNKSGPKSLTIAGSSKKAGGPVRPRYTRAATTTIDLLRGSGMRVVHALDRGSRGLEGDLERCRRKLLEDGYVHPQNFDDPSKIEPAKDEFDVSRIGDVARRYVRPRVNERRQRCATAKHEYQKWSAAKKGREEALKCLSLLEPPFLVARRDSMDAALEYWRRVGALLKAVDGSLLHDWIAWSQLGTTATKSGGATKSAWAATSTSPGIVSSLCEGSQAQSLAAATGVSGGTFDWAPAGSCASPASSGMCWCAFAPRGCDVQRSLSCGGVSPLRAALLRVLKSGIDFTIPFNRLGRWLAKQTEADYESGGDGEDGTSSVMQLWVGATELRRCLRDGGLALSMEEARLVVDALDNYAGNGKAKLADLKDLFAKPVRAGDVSTKLRRISHFEQTCHETGMPNAYRVSANPHKTRPSKYEQDVELKNGETRRRWTNPDLEKRRIALRKLGVRLPHRLEDEMRDLSERKHRGATSSGEDYDDDFGEEEDDDEDSEENGRYDDDFEDAGSNGASPSPSKRDKKAACLQWPGASRRLDYDMHVYKPWFADKQTPMPARSEMAAWGIWGKPRRRALDALRKMSMAGRHEERLREALAEGETPAPPELWAASLAELEAEGLSARDLTTRLVVRWRPNTSNAVPVAFFHLEFSGALGSRAQRENRFVEIACDPPSAQHDAFAFQHVVSGLEPNTTYVFRARAFNTFGPGPYTWRRLTTPPERPMMPVPVKLGPRAVVLRWRIPETLEKRAAELRCSFEEAAAADDVAQDVAARLNELHAKKKDERHHEVLPDAAHHGTLVRRSVWLALLDEKYRGLLDFLRRAHTSAVALQHVGDRPATAGGSKLSLLDELEESDAEVVGWHWVRSRLAAVFEIGNDRTSDDGACTTRGLVTTGEGARMVSEALDRFERGLGPGQDTTGDVQRFQQIAAPTTYVLERCLSERDADYDEVLRTRFTEAAVNGLEPDSSYRFRVRAVNADGDISPPSKSVVINTLLETPAPPRLALVSETVVKRSAKRPTAEQGGCTSLVPNYVVSSTSVKLAWPRHAAFSSGTDRRAESARKADLILARWTNAAADDNGAVSLEAVFAKFDRDRKDALTLDTLPLVLTKLGAHRTHASDASAMRAIWDELRDAARDVVRTKDFAAWWNSDKVTHVLQRDRGRLKGSVDERGQPTGLVTTYRGQGRATEVRGLQPNTVYRFMLRLVTSRSHSRASAPLEVWTAPASPSAPRVVRVEPKAIVVKWYPGPGGARKYALESRLVEVLDEIAFRDYATKARRATRSTQATRYRITANAGWKIAYEGKENAIRIAELEPRAVYRFRVRALNGDGHASAPSDLVQATTSESPPLVPRKAAEQFTRDCGRLGDVVVGDTILFSERLYVDAATGKLCGEAARGGIDQGAAALPLRPNVASVVVGTSNKHIGDRTIAGHVVAEAFYRSAQARKDARDLRIQIVWCTTSNDAASAFHLRNGEVIQRLAGHVTQFHTFRTPWEDEEHRRPYADEVTAIDTICARWASPTL